MSTLYHEDLLDEAKNPSNFGTLKNADKTTTHYNASCGDSVSVSVQLSEDKQTILDLKWTGEGCIISQATMSVLSTELIGKSVTEIKKLRQKDLLDFLGLSEIAPGRVKCLSLGLSAVQKLVSELT